MNMKWLAEGLAHYLDLYVKAAKDEEDLRRRSRTAYLELKLLGYAYGTTGYEEIRQKMINV